MLAAIVLWLLFAFVFWCMMAGATRGDAQLQAALDHTTSERGKEGTPAASAGDHEPLSNAA